MIATTTGRANLHVSAQIAQSVTVAAVERERASVRVSTLTRRWWSSVVRWLSEASTAAFETQRGPPGGSAIRVASRGGVA